MMDQVHDEKMNEAAESVLEQEQGAENESPNFIESSELPDFVAEPEIKAEAEEIDPEDQPQWYVIHTYSGYENKVKATLEQVVENRGIQDMIVEVNVPMEEQVEIKDGKKKTVMRKKYPGYVLVKMHLTDDIWYIVRNTRGVTGFVGPNSKPVPLTEEELATMGMANDWIPVIDYGVGDSVKVINGPLESFIGVVDAISNEKKKVRVLVSMFGRETPVELDFTQVIRI